MARPGTLVLVAGAVLLLLLCGAAMGAKRAAIPDDLRDVVDDEEDEDWRRWGAGSGTRDVPDRPPPDLSRMDPAALREEILRGHGGPSLGFVKLRPGVRRSREEVAGIATRWSNVLRTGSVAAKFVAVDFGTLMFTMERGRDMRELKEFILGQPEAYEFKVGDQFFRRPGDPPLDQVIQMLRKQTKKEDEL
ncbi:hypothetical protein CFC21_059102 [Triticum aestivum]|uniref:Mesoderm development candidate 2 n=3 Tax=Triticum TaxID=4564 RepID=A0A9R0TF16_TRITD|nr:uncharacterized protein LOC123089359 [Triticum aestivum]KAF7050784.1 hypothetical protein CFC21_059102 [Triticum aestivum]VAI09965.1 unnamed protein product [Triticum turgidum subsp. durum]